MIGIQTPSYGVTDRSRSAEPDKHPLVVQVWGSNLPGFLKPFAAKLAAMSDRRGTGRFQYTITVRSLYEATYRDGHRSRTYCERSIQYFLRALEHCEFLTIISNGAGLARTFVLHPDKLATVWMTDPMLRPPHARKRYQGTLRSKRDRAQAAKSAKQEPSAAPPPDTPDIETPRQPKPPPNNVNYGALVVLVHQIFDEGRDLTTAACRARLADDADRAHLVFGDTSLDTAIEKAIRSRLLTHHKYVPPSVKPEFQARILP